MKSPQQQRIEKVQKIAELITQAAENTAQAFNETLPIEKRGEHALKAIMIQEVELPLVMQTPIQVKEYQKGGIVRESGSELIMQPDSSAFWPVYDAYKVKPELLVTKDCSQTFTPQDEGTKFDYYDCHRCNGKGCDICGGTGKSKHICEHDYQPVSQRSGSAWNCTKCGKRMDGYFIHN